MDCAKWIGSLVVAWLLAGPGVAVAQTAEAPPLSAQLEACTTSALPAQRVAAFVGSMPAMSGSMRMQMRFDLQRRRPDEKLWHKVPGVQGFGIWETALPGRAGFVYHKRVDGLQVPASYRAIVRFRWYRPDGTVARHGAQAHAPRAPSPTCVRTSRSAPCARCSTRARRSPSTRSRPQRGALAGGRVRGARRRRGSPRSRALGPASSVEVAVLAPACLPGRSSRAVVDADRRIDEADERNALQARLPARAADPAAQRSRRPRDRPIDSVQL